MGTDLTRDSAKVKAVIRVAAGNFLEMYDFMVFGYYAAAIGRDIFPEGQRSRATDVGICDVRRGISDAAAGRAGSGRLHR